jgi:putative transposase
LLLNETLFFWLDHARAKIGAWANDHNHERAHSCLGYATPVEYAALFAASGDRLRQLGRLEAEAADPLHHQEVSPSS